MKTVHSTIRFLSSNDAIRAEVLRILESQTRLTTLKLAVAFWGDGVEKLFARDDVNYEIVCNLNAGGTNPHVIRALRCRSNFAIRQNPRLHAKVVLGETGVIVSSANFSSNGLSLSPIPNIGWLEAGVFLPSPSTEVVSVGLWYATLWDCSSAISDEDLLSAELRWDSRPQGEVEPIAEKAVLDKDSLRAAAKSTIEMFDVRTIHVHGRIQPDVRNIRSAAAVLALGGERGDSMHYSAFVFLFSGGETSRAFKNHDEAGKFIVEDSFVRLQPEFIGYFVGTDGTLESSTDSKRRKSAGETTLKQVAAWMLGEENRPPEFDGEVKTARFSRRVHHEA